MIMSEEREWCDCKGSHKSVCEGKTKEPIGTLDFHEEL